MLYEVITRNGGLLSFRVDADTHRPSPGAAAAAIHALFARRNADASFDKKCDSDGGYTFPFRMSSIRTVFSPISFIFFAGRPSRRPAHVPLHSPNDHSPRLHFAGGGHAAEIDAIGNGRNADVQP